MLQRLLLISFVIGCRTTIGADSVPKPITKFFDQFCFRCHGAEKQESSFRLDELERVDAGTAPQWTKVLERLTLGEMPPADELQPSVAEAEPVTDWLAKELARLDRRPTKRK